MSGPRTHDSLLDTLPLVGREEEIRILLGALTESPGRAPGGAPGLLVLHGPGGVGKTRLTRVLETEAERREWTVLRGQAYPPESRVPYATVSDAFLPLLRAMPRERLAVLTRGGEAELGLLFPGLGATDFPSDLPRSGEPDESRVRLFWTFVEMVQKLASRDPVLVVLEDLQWVDASSLELIHFTIRNTTDHPVRFVATYADEFMEDRNPLQRMVGSLSSNGLVKVVTLGPFSPVETRSLISQAFDVPGSVVEPFADRLHRWTRGNAFFIAETLRSLVEDGILHHRRDTWLGWEAEDWGVPRTIREVVVGRVGRCGPLARSLANTVAVAGDRMTFSLLRALSDAPERDVVDALEELRIRGILEETEEGDAIVYRFAHPLFRECVYEEMGLARARTLHRAMADALERRAEASPGGLVEELAYHYLRAGELEADLRAVPKLVAAGRRALERHADLQAAQYLEKALSVLDSLDDGPHGDLPASLSETLPHRSDLLLALGRAYQRRGQYRESMAIWKELLSAPGTEDHPDRRADLHRRMALACFWSGRHDDALSHFERAVGAEGASAPVICRSRLGYGICLQDLGRWDEARAAVAEALTDAEEADHLDLRAAAHRALALLHTWRGPPDQVRHHGARAIELARRSGDRNVAFWGHWALAVLEGLTGHLDLMDREIGQALALADELHSPVLRLWIDEIRIEKAYVTGEWESGVAMGERAIALAEALGQRALLPRLQVWTALIHLGRDDLERGEKLVMEAWNAAYGERPSGEASGHGGHEGEKGKDSEAGEVNIHVAIPAHIGVAALHLAREEYEKAMEVGEAGLALADESGYAIWGIHRLLPLVGEAYLLLRDLDGARRISDRVREGSEAMGHALGFAWADVCDALVTWLDGDVKRGAEMLSAAAERLESIPVVPEAARVRRQLAGRLAELGDRDGALEELRRCHDIFQRLGARRELEKARGQFRELDSRPPSRSQAPGAGDLTGREVEVALLVAERSSNKAIARKLGISPRTVGTHLSNIFKKVDVSSREELADLVRQGRVPLAD